MICTIYILHCISQPIRRLPLRMWCLFSFNIFWSFFRFFCAHRICMQNICNFEHVFIYLLNDFFLSVFAETSLCVFNCFDVIAWPELHFLKARNFNAYTHVHICICLYAIQIIDFKNIFTHYPKYVCKYALHTCLIGYLVLNKIKFIFEDAIVQYFESRLESGWTYLTDICMCEYDFRG